MRHTAQAGAAFTSREVGELDTDTARKCLALLDLCRARGIDLLITCTYRNNAAQQALWNQGRITPGPVVTWAKPGESMHQTRRAFDVVPLRAGRPVWGTAGLDGDLWRAVGDLGERVGLEWAGRWSAGKREFPHFQNIK